MRSLPLRGTATKGPVATIFIVSGWVLQEKDYPHGISPTLYQQLNFLPQSRVDDVKFCSYMVIALGGVHVRNFHDDFSVF